MRVTDFSVLEDHLELVQDWILLKGRFLQREVPHETSSLGMEELLALGCCFYETAEATVSYKKDLTRECFIRPMFTMMATSKAMQLKVCIHVLENQGCLDNLLQFCMH